MIDFEYFAVALFTLTASFVFVVVMKLLRWLWNAIWPY